MAASARGIAALRRPSPIAGQRGERVQTTSLSGPVRVLVMVEQRLIAEVIKLTLNHGVYVTREAKDVPAPGRSRDVRAGRVVTRDEILDALWGVDYAAESDVVDRHIRNPRAKLQNVWRKPRFIATGPGQGYRFVPTFSDAGSAS
jgi:hypothetical protein